MSIVKEKDKKIYDIIQSELNRQNGYLNLLHLKISLVKLFLKLQDLFLQINMLKAILEKDIMVDVFMLMRQKI